MARPLRGEGGGVKGRINEIELAVEIKPAVLIEPTVAQFPQ